MALKKQAINYKRTDWFLFGVRLLTETMNNGVASIGSEWGAGKWVVLQNEKKGFFFRCLAWEFSSGVELTRLLGWEQW